MYTAAPFGLTAVEHMAWIYHDNGGTLWEELYQPLGVKPLLASNTGINMGGWFKTEINSLDDLKGLQYRMPGLGGKVIRRLGGVPVTVPPPEILTSLKTGVVDAVEWVGPWADLAKGLYAAPYYYGPGFHEPNGAAELLIKLDVWNDLPEDLKLIIESACMAEHAYSLSEIEFANPFAINKLVEEHGVKVRSFPDDLITAARTAAEEVFDDLAETNDISARIVQSYRAARDRNIQWSTNSIAPFLQARAT